MKSAETYYRAAEALKKAIQLNRADYAFSSNIQNKIVYLFDTNVMESYLQTSKDDLHDTSITFGELFEDRIALKVGHRLTTEFLLSGGLPGQRKTPAYMSAFHWNELMNRLGKLVSEASKLSAESFELSKDDIDALEKLRDLPDPRQFVEYAARVIPAGIMAVLQRTEAVTRRLERSLGDRQCVSPLGDAQSWQNAKDRVFRRDVAMWIADLKAIRDAATKQRPRVEHRSPAERSAREAEDQRLKIENDAQTLAAIQALYRENDEAFGDQRTLAFHLVTLDRSILDAVEGKRERLESEGIPVFVRHPRVFSPILNFSGMTRALSGMEWSRPVASVFAEVERAIDQLFESDFGGSRHDVHNIPPIIEPIKRWQEAARQLIAMNAGFFAEDVTEMEAVINRLKDKESLAAGSELLKETISRIRAEHALLLSNRALDHLSRNLSNLIQGNAPLGMRRAPVKIVGVQLVSGHTRVEASQSLDEALDGLLGRKSEYEIAAKVKSLRRQLAQDWNTPGGQLLASCIYLAIGAWQSARECADRCRQLVHKDMNKSTIWREASYAKSLAIRFSIKSRSDYNEASSALLTNVTTWSMGRRDVSTQLACLRDRIEVAALQQSVSVLQAIEDDTPFTNFGVDDAPFEILSGEEVRDEFDFSTSSMQALLEVLEDEYSLSDSHPYLIASLRRQLTINIVGAHVFRKLLSEKLSKQPFDRGELKVALEMLEDAGGYAAEMTNRTRPVPPIGQVYGTCAKFILEPDEAPVNQTLMLIEAIISDNILPHSDIVELRYLRSNLLSAGLVKAPTLPT
jgi:hypothetical protein